MVIKQTPKRHMKNRRKCSFCALFSPLFVCNNDAKALCLWCKVGCFTHKSSGVCRTIYAALSGKASFSIGKNSISFLSEHHFLVKNSLQNGELEDQDLILIQRTLNFVFDI